MSGAPGPLRHIVFYGSLMEGLTLPGKPDLAALGVTRVGPCRVQAELWDTGLGYPALTRPGDAAAGEVHGELWELADAAHALPVLDAYEGLHDGGADGAEYLRVPVPCVEPAGVEAWIYIWNGATDGMSRVTDGDWRGRLATAYPDGGAGAGAGYGSGSPYDR